MKKINFAKEEKIFLQELEAGKFDKHITEHYIDRPLTGEEIKNKSIIRPNHLISAATLDNIFDLAKLCHPYDIRKLLRHLNDEGIPFSEIRKHVIDSSRGY